ncbi:MAG: hypothetical protein GVY36_15885 [Verrucomicrobia bacterium]|jgi:hypothetical protein|nr:hypothetical protein [Verrucomicrobiota bacterium]
MKTIIWFISLMFLSSHLFALVDDRFDYSDGSSFLMSYYEYVESSNLPSDKKSKLRTYSVSIFNHYGINFNNPKAEFNLPVAFIKTIEGRSADELLELAVYCKRFESKRFFDESGIPTEDLPKRPCFYVPPRAEGEQASRKAPSDRA